MVVVVAAVCAGAVAPTEGIVNKYDDKCPTTIVSRNVISTAPAVHLLAAVWAVVVVVMVCAVVAMS